jgi:hypothetical protein
LYGVLSYAYAHVIVILLLAVTQSLLAPATAPAADQLKECCVRLMAAGIQSVKEDATKQHLLSLASPHQQRQKGQAEHRWQQQERLEQAFAEYMQLKESGCDPDDPGNVPTWSSIAKFQRGLRVPSCIAAKNREPCAVDCVQYRIQEACKNQTRSIQSAGRWKLLAPISRFMHALFWFIPTVL